MLKTYWCILACWFHRWDKSPHQRSGLRFLIEQCRCELLQHKQHRQRPICWPGCRRKIMDQLDPNQWLCWFFHAERVFQQHRQCELKKKFEFKASTFEARLNSPPRLWPIKVTRLKSTKNPLAWRLSRNSASKAPTLLTWFLDAM